MTIKKDEVKEEFCTSCTGDGLAIAGVDSTSGSVTKSKHKVWKQILLWSGVALCIIVAILVVLGVIIK